jgi:hypothetical protein
MLFVEGLCKGTCRRHCRIQVLRQDEDEVCGVLSGGILIYDGEPYKPLGTFTLVGLPSKMRNCGFTAFSLLFYAYLLQQNKTLYDSELTVTISSRERGQGFGLSGVIRLTGAPNRTLTFESEIGKGTTFKIAFPITAN